MNAVRPALIAAGLALLISGLGFVYWWGQSHTQPAAPAPAKSTPNKEKILYWYDPMVPQEHYPGPGKSSMNMTLIPKYANDGRAGDGMSIAPGVRQNLGIRTVVAKRGTLASTLHVPGTITWDQRQERVVSARVDAIVERLYVRAPFEPVRAGQPLASVIAPAWSTALAEADALDGAQSAPARALRSASRARLHALGMPAGSDAGRGGTITLNAPISGVVSEIAAREGQSAPAGTLLFRINGDATVWVDAAIPQAGIAGVRSGTPVTVTVDALPGQEFTGRVEAVLPQIDPANRTQRARIVLDNHDGALAPGMFAQIELNPVGGSEYPLVPSDAVISPGDQARVITLGNDGTFRPVAVRVGRSGGGMTEILTGLTGGERVVASGQFLIDSEANLSGALDRLGGAGGHDHDNHNPEPRP
jgi:Cu(I)/Ag(I) efflux system membrane fusion protein